MGRRAIKIEPLSGKQRLISFRKRRFGLMKKARELSVLCGVRVGVVIDAPEGLTLTFASDNDLQEILSTIGQPRGEGRMDTSESDFAAFDRTDVELNYRNFEAHARSRTASVAEAEESISMLHQQVSNPSQVSAETTAASVYQPQSIRAKVPPMLSVSIPTKMTDTPKLSPSPRSAFKLTQVTPRQAAVAGTTGVSFLETPGIQQLPKLDHPGLDSQSHQRGISAIGVGTFFAASPDEATPPPPKPDQAEFFLPNHS